MKSKQRKLPLTEAEFERAGERFRTATAALKEVNAWLERQGQDPPPCILVRCARLSMLPDAYYRFYRRAGNYLEEIHAIEEWAIQQVQPEWTHP